jgi:ribosomal protein S18 acetylase RimI-like enzyme
MSASHEPADEIRLQLAGADRLDEVADLWLALHRHHREVSALQPLVADDQASWQRRRQLYVEALTGHGGFLVLAAADGRALGYALVRIEHGPDDTWPVGDRYAELYSLAVLPEARRMGLGTRILDFVDRELAERGIHDLQVAVMVGNDEALRFDERRGLRPAEVVLWRLGDRTQP